MDYVFVNLYAMTFELMALNAYILKHSFLARNQDGQDLEPIHLLRFLCSSYLTLDIDIDILDAR